MKRIDINIKKELPIILIIIMMFAASIYFYPQLPDKIPTHWNFKGEIDGYSGKLSGAFLMPVMNTIMYGLFIFMPAIDPKKENYKLFESTYIYFRYLFHIFFLGIHGLIIAAALGYNVDTGRLVTLAVSLLLMLMGNVMGRLKHNYFVGIKTPWTLADEEVWRKTHRLGAILWTAGGLMGVIMSLLRQSMGWVFIAVIAVMTFIPIVYSYLIFSKLKK
ncbi:MAG TPA: SdpI family protein [Bacillota bacterium]|nr:SdpI family protein [Bacillota bacterium]